MASKFQSRLVGTVILVAVGIIVLPDLLDGEKQHYQEDVASIPIKPELDSEMEVFELLDPVEEQIALPDSPVEVVLDAQTPETETDEPLPVVINEVSEKNDYQDSAWIIQLMALKNADNAATLVKDLQKRGYQAHMKKENDFTRVIIGPDVSKSKLEQQLVELQKITGSNGRLLKFKPLNP
ncbi:SPOR domain-containing protein [Vibrio sp. 10N.261.55.A7]|uniref:SPOR domain-containing protein n=1 Tax=Vibrio sp. 10N.261.55.A7 TaxID=1880851 RepID=UPI000C8255DB|nr:SPOR domain-containing protein [Vibrio sp. 10N.261.55.A7]PMJ88274.1 cell division protein DedD [Vibrio sp. 10N.261.55.A7]